eukprot:TRINITY_DN2485_c0_g3_i1.p1 TRINITY_DN2485_c0_g3~~TRINITY_DN2485_c0_g3_i1.p1  ORF type:complete len:476 (-),score=80.23 TRINITY_DN2485_c0_g3_i1:58-1437(-)
MLTKNTIFLGLSILVLVSVFYNTLTQHLATLKRQFVEAEKTDFTEDQSIQRDLEKLKSNTKNLETELANLKQRLNRLETQNTSKIDAIVEKMRYWSGKKGSLDHVTRYLLFSSWPGELAYSFAYVMNRTLVLPPAESNSPFPPLAFTEVYDLDDMKAGVPVLEINEFKALPNYETLIQDKIVANFTDIGTSESVFVFPKIPHENSSEYRNFLEWRAPRSPVGAWGIQIRDTYTIPRWNESSIVEFPPAILFCHFYIYFYFTPESQIKFHHLTKSVRDHVHYKEKIFAMAAKIIDHLPERFSTMHYRRGDLQFPENRNVKPVTVFNNTLLLLQEGECLYVATDEETEVFKNEFLTIFGKRYRIEVFATYAYLVKDIPNYLIPLVEQIVCSQGRVFIGTRQSTFSGYITRLRGYMKNIENKDFYWTTVNFPDGYKTEESFKPSHHKTWNREYPEAWESIQD